ncbi:MAG: FAD-binding oxidoreductase [Nitrospiraceae bacterium]
MAEIAQPAEVIRITDLSAHVRELVLSPLEHRVSYQPGQWVSLKLPVGQKPPLNRAYSLAEPETPSGHLSLVFDRVPTGLGSPYLFSLKIGDRVPLSGPYGKFVLPQPDHAQLLLIGRYTGIVPIRCLARSVIPLGNSMQVTVISAAPSESERLYHDEFLNLALRHSQFQYWSTIYGHDVAQDAANDVLRVIDLLQQFKAQARQCIPMICGLRDFVRPLRAYFMDLGFDRKGVRVETYD